ncbi:MAG TPA: MgtC/SapB family protein [Devosia sp.]|jgi:putative Mg2+ transporter-C (MgtC) family protein|uniref:MgtC/SapB family protein n=1 Tax=Devosia sp. TaxID=1871048 RepID=UPI002DDCCAA4|nr:MgtC/SapB family protein [Devosia sp.]HEV2514731.1 MgtC/SapB family protein [Devosia sp.]
MDLVTSLGYEPTHTPHHIILIRLLSASVLGALIGWERGSQSGTAGLRTHILVALAAALFTTLAFEIYQEALAGGSSNSDPIRAIEAVTAGIAFLGAGAIFQQRGSVQGLTTGAGMWLAGAVGVCAALGYYLVAIVVAVFAVLVLAAMRAFSHGVVSADNGKLGAGTEPEKDR